MGSSACCCDDGIDDGIEDEIVFKKKPFKLLLLGALSSGKSTIFRQVKILFGDGYDQEQKLTIASCIYQNMVQSMKRLVEQLPNFGKINEDKKNLIAEVESLSDYEPFPDVKEIGKLIEALWEEPGIKTTYRNRSKFQLDSNPVHYFFNKAEDIMKDGYLPSEDDILHCRIFSCGVKQELFTMDDDIQFRLMDVGGSRSEIKKWVQCFENVTAVLYVVAVNEYDQLCFEDNETNRLMEALDLFEDIVNSEWFADIPIILFLNKKDLLLEKIRNVPPQEFFKDYSGDGQYKSFLQFLKEEFHDRNQQDRQIITHVSCATDTDDIKNVFHNQVKKILH